MEDLEKAETLELAFRLNELKKIINNCEMEKLQIVKELQRRYPNSKIEEHIDCKKLERRKNE